MQASDVLSHARPRLLSRAEYDRLVEIGIYRVEVCDQSQNGRFQRVRYFEREQELAPAVFPDIVVRVSDVFP